MSVSILAAAAQMRGIDPHYTDAWGAPAEISTHTQARLLQAMGYPADDDSALAKAMQDEAQREWLTALDPVQVVRRNEKLELCLRLPIELVNDSYQLVLKTEQGERFSRDIVPVEGTLINATEIGDGEFHEYLVSWELDLPLGYHQLRLEDEQDEALGQMRVICAPRACFKPAKIASGEKVWGLSVQLYCVRSESNWGMGDFTDLAFLTNQAARVGADFIGLNPIHALYPNNPESCSPYSPSSRRWLNVLYIDATKLPCFDSDTVQALVADTAFKDKIAALRATDWVDYAGVTEVKMAVFRLAFEAFEADTGAAKDARSTAFEAFIEAGGDSLQTLAVYDALQASLKAKGQPSWGWPVFPESLQEAHLPEVAAFANANQTDIRFYLFLQWQAAVQLAAADQVAKDAGMSVGIYRDLAVGVSAGSAEIWGNKALYAVNASVGAPPDILGPLGQDWGLPPMDPKALFEQGYQPIVDLFDANMQSCGALRIDHVMALLRLWWVSKGDGPKDGGYVQYPVDDLLGILALESHRHQSLVIGEDLGTVPDEIRGKLASNGVHSYRVFFFEQAEDGGFYSPSHYPEQSMATLTTHDMPTLIGYWHCDDLALGKSVGLYPDEEVLTGLYQSRHENKQRILDSLHGHGMLPEHFPRDVNQVGMTRELNFALQRHMAAGSSAMLSLQLEDWLEMDQPVNIPGTSDQYPNWRRKLSRTLEDCFCDQNILHLARDLSEARKKAS